MKKIMKKRFALAVAFSVTVTSTMNMDVATVLAASKGKVTSIKVTNLQANAITIKKGKSAKLNVKVVTSGKGVSTKFSVKSSNKKIVTAKVSGKNVVVTGKKNGKATVTITSKGDKKKKVNIKVTVGTPVTKVSIKKTASVTVGKKITLNATITPKKPSNKTLIWKSSNVKIAKVSSKGVVTGVKAGKVNITATAADGSGKEAICKVTVKAAKKSETNKTTTTTKPTTKQEQETTKQQQETTKQEQETTKQQQETTKQEQETTKQEQETTKAEEETTKQEDTPSTVTMTEDVPTILDLGRSAKFEPTETREYYFYGAIDSGTSCDKIVLYESTETGVSEIDYEWIGDGTGNNLRAELTAGTTYYFYYRDCDGDESHSSNEFIISRTNPRCISDVTMTEGKDIVLDDYNSAKFVPEVSGIYKFDTAIHNGSENCDFIEVYDENGSWIVGGCIGNGKTFQQNLTAGKIYYMYYSSCKYDKHNCNSFIVNHVSITDGTITMTEDNSTTLDIGRYAKFEPTETGIYYFYGVIDSGTSCDKIVLYESTETGVSEVDGRCIGDGTGDNLRAELTEGNTYYYYYEECDESHSSNEFVISRTNPVCKSNVTMTEGTEIVLGDYSSAKFVPEVSGIYKFDTAIHNGSANCDYIDVYDEDGSYVSSGRIGNGQTVQPNLTAGRTYYLYYSFSDGYYNEDTDEYCYHKSNNFIVNYVSIFDGAITMTEDNATTLDLGGYAKFEPTETGTYYFYGAIDSGTSCDTIMLYESTETGLSKAGLECIGDGTGNNLCAELTEGNTYYYYYEKCGKSHSSNEFIISRTNPVCTSDVTMTEGKEIVLDDYNSAKFVPEVSGVYKFDTAIHNGSENCDEIYVYDEDGSYISFGRIGNGRTVQPNLTAGRTYYLYYRFCEGYYNEDIGKQCWHESNSFIVNYVSIFDGAVTITEDNVVTLATGSSGKFEPTETGEYYFYGPIDSGTSCDTIMLYESTEKGLSKVNGAYIGDGPGYNLSAELTEGNTYYYYYEECGKSHSSNKFIISRTNPRCISDVTMTEGTDIVLENGNSAKFVPTVSGIYKFDTALHNGSENCDEIYVYDEDGLRVEDGWIGNGNTVQLYLAAGRTYYLYYGICDRYQESNSFIVNYICTVVMTEDNVVTLDLREYAKFEPTETGEYYFYGAIDSGTSCDKIVLYESTETGITEIDCEWIGDGVGKNFSKELTAGTTYYYYFEECYESHSSNEFIISRTNPVCTSNITLTEGKDIVLDDYNSAKFVPTVSGIYKFDTAIHNGSANCDYICVYDENGSIVNYGMIGNGQIVQTNLAAGKNYYLYYSSCDGHYDEDTDEHFHHKSNSFIVNYVE